MPSAVVTGERMKLINNDRADVAQQVMRVDHARDEDRFERLRRRQKDVRGLRDQTLPEWLADVPVP
jgi:hypothetical protein